MYILAWTIESSIDHSKRYLNVNDKRHKIWVKSPHNATKFPTSESVRLYMENNSTPEATVVMPVHEVEWY